MNPPDPVGLLDTSLVIDLMVCDPEQLPAAAFVSAVTLAELSAGPLVARTDDERLQRQHVLQLAESTFDPLPFDAACARHFGAVVASLRRSGRKSRARGLDALIAATALAHDLPLYTKNPQDFEGIAGLSVRSGSGNQGPGDRR